MKILHVIPSLSPVHGGPPRIVKAQCGNLAQAGLDITILTTDDDGPGRLDVPLNTPIEQDGYQVIYVRRTSSIYSYSWPLTRWLAAHITEYDMLHIHGLFSYIPSVAAFLAKRRRVPYTITPHGLLLPWAFLSRRTHLKKGVFHLIDKHMFNNSSVVHVTSQLEAQELRALGIHVPIKPIYFGLDMPPTDLLDRAKARAHYQYDDDQIILFFMGRLHPIKGLDLLLPAFAEALQSTPNLKLALAGQGSDEYLYWLKSETARLNITEQVIWLEYLANDAKWQALAACDVLVAPSYLESFGLAILEGLICHTPVIVSDRVAIHQEINESQAGKVISCEVNAVTRAIQELVQDADLRHTMGQRARQLAIETFSHQTMVDQFLELYYHYGSKA